MKKQKWNQNRISPACCSIDNELGLDIKLFANDSVFTDKEAFEELFDFLDVERAIQDIQEKEKSFFNENQIGINRVVLTPDFHKGSGIPVGTVVETSGFVIPAAIGNDICCGMRLLATDLPCEKLESHWKAIQKRLRELFFEGQRDIPMSPRQREAVLRFGLPGLVDTIDDNRDKGIYRYYDFSSQRDDLERIHNNGGFKTNRLFGFEKLIQSSGAIDGRDPQIGSVGGGNHFVELQCIEELLCKQSARELGLVKGNLAIMVHSGSVSLGHAVGGHFIDRAKEIFPKQIKDPKNDFYVLPMTGSYQKEGLFYLESMRNAANFAFANRLFLGLMALRAIQEVLGISVSSRLIYDAPHNLVFDTEDGNYLHRKGATPAEGPLKSSDWMGRPVIIPGSMGSASYLLTGLGNADSLESACHGAGRVMSRGKASHYSDEIYDQQTKKLRIVTKVDPNSPQMLQRRDILEKYKERIKEEAPYAYKPITPVIESVKEAGIANPVAKLMPLCTVKG
jgi:tRNA-splicing ligase RtcB (3'-phosphate/5'-hydroxy nucleic acid ligase)